MKFVERVFLHKILGTAPKIEFVYCLLIFASNGGAKSTEYIQ